MNVSFGAGSVCFILYEQLLPYMCATYAIEFRIAKVQRERIENPANGTHTNEPEKKIP